MGQEGEAAAASPAGTPRGAEAAPQELSPVQLQLVMQHFDRVIDDSGQGRLTPAAIRAFLQEMGLEPSDFEVRLFSY